MTFIQFFGGNGEIGGNKILLKDRDVKIWLDFGQSFSYGSKFFIDWLLPRKISGCKDHFEFNLLPKIKGLYSEDKLVGTSVKYEEPNFDGIFLTHAHFDHIAHIYFLDEKIPIFLGKTTKKFLECQENTTLVSNYGFHKYVTFNTGSVIKIGHLEIEPIHVDHSIPASYGFIIHTSKGTIGYTGDLRLHGPKSKMTLDFIDISKDYNLKCLISEGTRVSPKENRKNLSEKNVFDNINRVMNKSKGLVIVTSYGRDIDRLNSFFNASVLNQRIFIVTPRIAYLLKNLKNYMEIPEILYNDQIRVLFKRKKSGKYDDKDYFPWEREFLNKIITSKEIKRSQSKYILHLPFSDFTEMIDIHPIPGSDFIYSMSEPFNEEDLSFEIIKNWINHFNLHLHPFHASGHASSKALSKIIEIIRPNRVIPVHTEHPEYFQSLIKNSEINIPLKNMKIDIK